MAITTGIFSSEANFEARLATSLGPLGELCGHLKAIGLNVVLTSGSFDLIHLGHVKYLARAKEFGDVLVVGVDSDAKIRERKGDDRPLVPERERLEMLAYQRPVDLLYLKQPSDPRWALIKAVRPDVLIVTADHSYSETDLEQLREYCGSIEILARQADVTTSERLRQIYMSLSARLTEAIPGLIDTLSKRP